MADTLVDDTHVEDEEYHSLTDSQSSDDDRSPASSTFLDPEDAPSFTFPKLSPDGSVDNLRSASPSPPPGERRGYDTPPAALSARGHELKMKEQEKRESASSLSENYDMVDDVSDVSDDGNDTASLGSDRQPLRVNETAGEEALLVEAADGDDGIIMEEVEKAEEVDDIARSVDDQETPRQSTVHEPVFRPTLGSTIPDADEDDHEEPKNAPIPAARSQAAARNKKMIFKYVKNVVAPLMSLLFLNLLITMCIMPTPVMRQMALSKALGNSVNASEVNMTYLIPHGGPHTVGRYNVNLVTKFQSVDEDLFLVSLPVKHVTKGNTTAPSTSSFKVPGKSAFMELRSARATRSSGTEVPTKTSKLVDGVYSVAVSPRDGCRNVSIDLEIRAHKGEILKQTIEYHSRNCWLDSVTRVTKDMTVTPSKDLILGRARSFGDKIGQGTAAFGADLKHSAAEAVSDLAHLGNSAVSTFDSVAAGYIAVSNAATKDFVIIRNELVRFTTDVSTVTAQSAKALIPSRTTLTRPFTLSRERAAAFRDVIKGRKGDNTSSAAKDLSARLHRIFHSTADGLDEKTASFSEIARCSIAQDYKACRMGQKARALSTSQPSRQQSAKAKRGNSDSRKSRYKEGSQCVKGNPGLHALHMP